MKKRLKHPILIDDQIEYWTVNEMTEGTDITVPAMRERVNLARKNWDGEDEWELAEVIAEIASQGVGGYYGKRAQDSRPSRLYEAQNPPDGTIKVFGDTMMRMVIL